MGLKIVKVIFYTAAYPNKTSVKSRAFCSCEEMNLTDELCLLGFTQAHKQVMCG
jgi:hypothetical protein